MGDLGNPVEWMSPSILLLTTGRVSRDHPQTGERILRSLHESKIAGMCVAITPDIDQIGPVLIREGRPRSLFDFGERTVVFRGVERQGALGEVLMVILRRGRGLEEQSNVAVTFAHRLLELEQRSEEEVRGRRYSEREGSAADSSPRVRPGSSHGTAAGTVGLILTHGLLANEPIYFGFGVSLVTFIIGSLVKPGEYRSIEPQVEDDEAVKAR